MLITEHLTAPAGFMVKGQDCLHDLDHTTAPMRNYTNTSAVTIISVRLNRCFELAHATTQSTSALDVYHSRAYCSINVLNNQCP